MKLLLQNERIQMTMAHEKTSWKRKIREKGRRHEKKREEGIFSHFVFRAIFHPQNDDFSDTS